MAVRWVRQSSQDTGLSKLAPFVSKRSVQMSTCRPDLLAMPMAGNEPSSCPSWTKDNLTCVEQFENVQGHAEFEGPWPASRGVSKRLEFPKTRWGKRTFQEHVYHHHRVRVFFSMFLVAISVQDVPIGSYHGFCPLGEAQI